MTAMTTKTASARKRHLTALGLLAAGSLAVAGCEDGVLVVGTCPGPHAPVGVYSVTGDEEIYLYWYAVDDEAGDFVVYRSRSADGTYREIGHTDADAFTDRSVENGETYYYAVTAVDACGQESELSRELVHDTPRPEGADARLYDSEGESSMRSGWDFSTYRALPWDHPDTDIYLVWSGGVPLLAARDKDTDIQDAGFGGFDDVTWAPGEGWSPSGTAEVIVGHLYVVWTRNDHFAKVRVTGLGEDSVRFDWAYQIAPGNPELVRHERSSS